MRNQSGDVISSHLTRYVDDTVQQSFTDLDTAEEGLDARINELESGEENKDAPEEGFTDALKLLMRYRFMAEERTEEQGRSLAFDLFSSSRKPVPTVRSMRSITWRPI